MDALNIRTSYTLFIFIFFQMFVQVISVEKLCFVYNYIVQFYLYIELLKRVIFNCTLCKDLVSRFVFFIY